MLIKKMPNIFLVCSEAPNWAHKNFFVGISLILINVKENVFYIISRLLTSWTQDTALQRPAGYICYLLCYIQKKIRLAQKFQ